MGQLCSRRQQAQAESDEVPFWEHEVKSKEKTEKAAKKKEQKERDAEKDEASKPAAKDTKEEKAKQKEAKAKSKQEEKEEEEEEEEPKDPPGYAQAALLKEEGNAKFAAGVVEEAMESWLSALDALCMPPDTLDTEEDAKAACDVPNNPRVMDLRIGVLLNLAAGHRKLKQWRSAITYCDDVVAEQPLNIKALFRKADSLGELTEWSDAEQVAAALHNSCDAEGKKLASQLRATWQRKQKAAEGQQKKMWANALDAKANAKAKEEEKPKTAAKAGAKGKSEAWIEPKVETMSVFDLRMKAIKWNEDEDFDDKIWKGELGRRNAAYYQGKAVPLSLLAAAALADISFPSDLIVHLILDGNMAPFQQPHEWACVLERCKGVKSIMVIYVDIGATGDLQNQQSVPYGVLLPPIEVGKSGDRVARAARFLGSYKDFQAHCKDYPMLAKPTLAFWADVPMYGFRDEDLAKRIEAYNIMGDLGCPCVVTQGGEVHEPGSPKFSLKIDDSCNLSMAILQGALGAKFMCGLHWNRFVVPLDRGPSGIVAAHCLIGVFKVIKAAAKPSLTTVKRALTAKQVQIKPYVLLQPGKQEKEFEMVRKKQWEAFAQKLAAEGRLLPPTATAAEKNRQAMEFYQFCGMMDAAAKPS